MEIHNTRSDGKKRTCPISGDMCELPQCNNRSREFNFYIPPCVQRKNELVQALNYAVESASPDQRSSIFSETTYLAECAAKALNIDPQVMKRNMYKPFRRNG